MRETYAPTGDVTLHLSQFEAVEILDALRADAFIAEETVEKVRAAIRASMSSCVRGDAKV